MRTLDRSGGATAAAKSGTGRMRMVRNRRPQRITAAALIVAGGLLLWLAPSVGLGLTCLAVGVALELLGLASDHGGPSAQPPLSAAAARATAP